MAFSGPFLLLINSMYASLMARVARVVVAGLLFDDIRLLQGKRQGCPLSPLLFNLALDPLSRYLSGIAPLHGVHVGRIELYTALFDDNVLIFTFVP